MPSKDTKWQKPTPEMIELFDQVLSQDLQIERRKMFGFPAAFVNGHMFAWIHQNHIAVRLPEATRQRLVSQAQASPVDPSGKRMREYVEITGKLRDDQAATSQLVVQAFEYVAALPPKVKQQ